MRKTVVLVSFVLSLVSVRARAATTVQLNPGEWLTVQPDGGSLSVVTNKPTLIKVQCAASNESSAEAIEPATPSNQTATLRPGQAVIALPTGGALVVKLNTPTSVKIYCSAQTQTKWGIYDLVCCSRNGSLTFWGTIANVTKQSTLTKCSSTPSWQGYAPGKAGRVTISWGVKSGCAGNFGPFTWSPSTSLLAGKCYAFALDLDGYYLRISLYEITDCGRPSSPGRLDLRADAELIESARMPVEWPVESGGVR
ncbi:MAG: hypothetical protein HYX75_09805 [Acidobacteria bacterium]|nr:hypothetical protein [Acidobacteriota bacterium]